MLLLQLLILYKLIQVPMKQCQNPALFRRLFFFFKTLFCLFFKSQGYVWHRVYPLNQLDCFLPPVLLTDRRKYFSIISQLFKSHFYFRQDEPLNSLDKIPGGKKPTKPNSFYFVEVTQLVLVQTGSTFCYAPQASFDTTSSTLLLRAYSDSQLDLHRHLLSDQV